MTDLVAEIISRASIIKPWSASSSSSAQASPTVRHYRKFHESPPMLGFLCKAHEPRVDLVFHFVPVIAV
jgi:hypothetical protein